MNNISNMYQLIKEMSKLKLVLRNTITADHRNESTAEHSWSASMIALILMDELTREFGCVDKFKIIKLTLIHDVVEIYAGDVIAFDQHARQTKHKDELIALEKLMAIYPDFGKPLQTLWHEFEKHETIEAKIAKAADAICPIFQRTQCQQSYTPFGVTMEHLEKTKLPYFNFSQTFTKLFQRLKAEIIEKKLI